MYQKRLPGYFMIRPSPLIACVLPLSSWSSEPSFRLLSRQPHVQRLLDQLAKRDTTCRRIDPGGLQQFRRQLHRRDALPPSRRESPRGWHTLLSYDTSLGASSRPTSGKVATDTGDREPKGSTTNAASEGEGVGVPVDPRRAHPEQLGCAVYVHRLVRIVRRRFGRYRVY